jgi:septal ring factor EnvC (AmiA/AmiB activator)
MEDSNWFRKKWGTPEVPTDILFKKIEELEERITTLEQKYKGALIDIKHLEEENIETTNCLYENANSIDAVDARIDILAEHCGITEDV